jgi:PAS domain S-box-containing protein
MREGELGSSGESDPGRISYLVALAGLGTLYFLLAKAGLALASINPSATPIWPPSGIALAAVLLWGYRVWPAVFLGALLANATTAGTLATSAAIALGNTLECIIAAYLLDKLSHGRHTFETPAGVARFAAISFAPATVSATIGVSALVIAGLAQQAKMSSIWLTWWIGDVAGMLVLTPLIVLWATIKGPHAARDTATSGAIYLSACLVGLLAFSPLVAQSAGRGPLGFLAVVPLLWAALRGHQRDTSTVAAILCCFAVWGTVAGAGPFAQTTLNDSFLLLLMFMITATVPSLVLSADAAARRCSESELRRAQSALDQRVKERTDELAASNRALQNEIDQRMRAEADLRLQSAHLQEAQRLANLGSWVWDIKSGRVTWSDRLYQIYGLEPGEFKGTFEDFLRRLHPDDREQAKSKITAAYRSGGTFHLEERVVRPSGEVRNLQSTGEVVMDQAGQPVQMLGICQDITERVLADAAVRESEQHYRIMVEGIRDYAIYMLDRHGHVTSWNPGAARIKGYARDEIIGQHFRRFHTEQDRAKGMPEQSLALAERVGKYEGEGWRVRKDGSEFWAHVILDTIRKPDGELIGFVKITRDITERREAQISLEKAREQLAQAQTMEALGQLTGGIAHDFNNLLMIVSGHAQLLQRRLTDQKQLQAVEAIQSAANRGESLTRQLLAFSRRQALSPVVADLYDRVEAVREMLGSSLRGNIELAFDIAEDIWPVRIDVGELELALVNIVVNARDAMPNGGTLIVSARNVTLKTGDVGELQGDFVALSVSDSGTGIPAEVLPKIFDPFFTTKAVGKGTGLGLSQVYGFAHQSGGSVVASSVLDHGTTITIYLPRSRDAAMPKPEIATQKTGAAVDGLVLSVEDNAEVAQVTATLIEQFGYRVVRAGNASDALQCLQRDRTIDIVFSDIVMPGTMDGLALAQEIRKRHPDVPVILTTGYSDAAQTAKTQFPLLRKPFQASELERVLRDALSKRRAPDAAPVAGRRD